MARTPTPPLAGGVRFIDCINRTDLECLAALLHGQHRLEIVDEEPLVGRDANIAAWKGSIARLAPVPGVTTWEQARGLEGRAIELVASPRCSSEPCR